MAISSVNSNSINTAAYVAPQQDNAAAQAQEVQAAQAQETQAAQQQTQQSAPPPQEARPVVNTQGQTTGRLVNETA
ncbi:hypothetical protein AZ34_09355 [Hylemonella gracilis str. Niagara R]|uniref:Uncharacterized protein n=1 Tax=Hylemonella gracilis str. Niagara R TaxID=1458275 RepID=A0A016XNQ5_9BURK|nr:hypothetical protein [Hylemonella gracilis]EYC52848.1 hypothetical protein AZ34_09355 [Hylemonella gracilis str. Niagara R]